jgi:hypothetical protein
VKVPPKNATGRSCQACTGLSSSDVAQAATKPPQPVRDASFMTMSVSSSDGTKSVPKGVLASLEGGVVLGAPNPVSGTFARARFLLEGARLPAAANASTWHVACQPADHTEERRERARVLRCLQRA